MIAQNYRRHPEALALQLPLPFGRALVWALPRPTTRLLLLYGRHISHSPRISHFQSSLTRPVTTSDAAISCGRYPISGVREPGLCAGHATIRVFVN